MNSEWFLFKGTHHIGPFTKKEIEVMLKKGDIAATTLVWKEGEKSWEPMYRVDAFKALVEDPGKASKIDPNIDLKTTETAAKKKLPAPIKKNLNEGVMEEIKVDDELPPPIPLDVFAAQTTTGTNELKVKIPEIKKLAAKKNTDLGKIFTILIGLFFCGVVFYQYVLQSKSEINFKLKNVMPSYVEKLEATALKKGLDPKFSIVLSMDGRTVYVSSNVGSEIDLSIKLIPVPKRVLSLNPGIVFLKGRVLNHLGEFDKVYLGDNKEFYPGEYDYEIHATERHFINSYFPALTAISFFKGLNKKYKVNGNELIFASTPRDFDFKLNRFKMDVFKEASRPILEKQERVNTIAALLDQIAFGFIEAIKKIKKGSEISKFEQMYMKEIAPVIQNLVSEKEDFKNINSLISETTRLYLDLVTETKKETKLNKEISQKLIDLATTRSDAIKEKLKIEADALDNQINLLK